MSQTATEVLRREHEAILTMLEAATEVARRLDRDEHVEPRTLTDILEFFQLFADRCHHAKEEELLFPQLEAKGLPRSGGPTGVMMLEHEQGRALIHQMVEVASSYGSGARGAGHQWAAAARAYAALLRQHIEKENEILFRMAEQILSEDELRHLAESFEKLEEEKMGRGTHERLHAKMKELNAQVLSHGA